MSVATSLSDFLDSMYIKHVDQTEYEMVVSYTS